jgi:hypothetical protein
MTYDALAEVMHQYRESAKKHRRQNPEADPRLRPELWMVAFDPVEMLEKARRSELQTMTNWR